MACFYLRFLFSIIETKTGRFIRIATSVSRVLMYIRNSTITFTQMLFLSIAQRLDNVYPHQTPLLLLSARISSRPCRVLISRRFFQSRASSVQLDRFKRHRVKWKHLGLFPISRYYRMQMKSISDLALKFALTSARAKPKLSEQRLWMAGHEAPDIGRFLLGHKKHDYG